MTQENSMEKVKSLLFGDEMSFIKSELAKISAQIEDNKKNSDLELSDLNNKLKSTEKVITDQFTNQIVSLASNLKIESELRASQTASLRSDLVSRKRLSEMFTYFGDVLAVDDEASKELDLNQ